MKEDDFDIWPSLILKDLPATTCKWSTHNLILCEHVSMLGSLPNKPHVMSFFICLLFVSFCISLGATFFVFSNCDHNHLTSTILVLWVCMAAPTWLMEYQLHPSALTISET